MPFLLSSVANVAWLFLWHYERVTLSLAAMLLLLGALLWITRCLDRAHGGASRAERWCVRRVFSFYLGWISVATIVNVAVVLFKTGWRGGPLPGEGWAAITLAPAALLGIVFALVRRDRVYAGVIVWALTGIAVKNSTVVPVLLVACVAGAAVALAMAGSWLIERGQPARPSTLSAV